MGVGPTLLSLLNILGNRQRAMNALAEPRARALVIELLARAPDGSVYIKPSADLRAQIERTPSLRFAVFDLDHGGPLSGSSAELIAALGSLKRVKTNAMFFEMIGDPDPAASGTLAGEATPFGQLAIAIYGYSFEWRDSLHFLGDYSQGIFIYSGPLFVTAAAFIWFAVRRGLLPLNGAAQKAERIDMMTLEQRIPEAGIPCEVMPLVTAINNALTRLDVGVKQQRRFIANAAHQMRTPVAILHTRIESLDEHDLVHRHKSDLMRDIRRIHGMVEQLLIAARHENPGGVAHESINLANAIKSIVADYAPLAIDDDRQIEFHHGGTPIFVRGNRRAVECVVANLIDNALRAEPKGGTVSIRLDPGATIEVIDHGEGVMAADRETIFEPFWRKSEATPGTGLGLAIVKELVELHRGTISVEETPGGGATFKVTLLPTSTT